MANYVDKLLVYNEGAVQKVRSSDSIGLTGDFSVGGNLLVSGDIVASDTVNVLIGDNFLDLSSGYTNNVTAKAAGLTFNVKAASSFTALTATDFVAGVLATSAPKFTCSATVTTLSAGDLVQISGAAVAGNNGLFIVASVSGADVTIYGVGGTAVPAYALFCQNQFTASTGNTATITKVDLAVVAVADGVSIKDSAGAAFAVGKLVRAYYAGATVANFNGTTSGTGWSEVGASVTQTLQAAYEGGNTISMTAAEGDLTISGGAGTAAVNITPNKASQFVVSGASLTLGTATSGNFIVSSAGAMQMSGVGSSWFSSTGSVTVESSGSGNSTTINGYDGVEISALVGGNVDINAAAGLIRIGNNAVNQAIQIGTGGQRTITVGNTSGTTGLDVNLGTGGMTVDTTSGGVISLDAIGSRSNFTVTNERLDLKSVGALAGGTQVLIEATNTTGVSQVVAQADSNVILQAPTTTKYLYFLADADASTPFVAMEADSNSAGIYIGSEAFNSFIAIGTDGSRIVDIGNLNGGTEVKLHAGAGVSVDGTLTGNNYIRPGTFTTGSPLTGVAGALGFNTTTTQPMWHNGSSWQTFGSLASATTLQGAYDASTSPATITLANTKNLVVAQPSSGSAAIVLGANAASSFTVAGANLSLGTSTSGTVAVSSAGTLTVDSVGAMEINSSGGTISIGNDAVAQNILIGTGGAAREVWIGNTTAPSTVSAFAGNAYFSIYSDTSTADGAWIVSSEPDGEIYLSVGESTVTPNAELYLDSVGAAYLNSYVNGNTIDISTTNYTSTVYIATGTAAKTVNIGNATGATAVNVTVGSGKFNVTGETTHTALITSSVASGSDALKFSTSGARLHLGSGTDDYLVSNGTNVSTPGAFGLGAKATGSLPAAATVGAGGLVYDSTVGAPLWSNGTNWQTFGSLASATTLQGAYDASSPATITLAGSKSLTVALPGSGSAGISLNSNATSNWNVTDATLFLRGLGTSGAIVVQSVTAVGIDATTEIGIGTNADTTPVNIGTGATTGKIVTLGSTTGTSKVVVNTGSGGFDVNAGGALTIEGTGTSWLSLAAGSLTVEASTDTLALNGGTGVSIDALTSGTVDINASAGAIRIGNSAVNQNISIGSGGTRVLQLANAASSVMLGTSSSQQSRIGIYLPSAGGSVIAKGHVLYVQATSGNLGLADGDGSGTKEVVGVALSADVAGASDILVATVPGSAVPMKFTASPTGTDIGSPVYLSTTAGQVTMTAPSSGRVYRLGILLSSSADANSNYNVLYLPAFVADL